jgi:hypothetical protein
VIDDKSRQTDGTAISEIAPFAIGKELKWNVMVSMAFEPSQSVKATRLARCPARCRNKQTVRAAAPPWKEIVPYYGFSVTSVTIFRRQSGCLQAYKGVLKSTALTETKG